MEQRARGRLARRTRSSRHPSCTRIDAIMMLMMVKFPTTMMARNTAKVPSDMTAWVWYRVPDQPSIVHALNRVRIPKATLSKLMLPEAGASPYSAQPSPTSHVYLGARAQEGGGSSRVRRGICNSLAGF